jgi:electron transfer flavoprotein alpha subunit
MKTLIVENLDLNRLGELVTASKAFSDEPHLVALGEGVIPGGFARAYQTAETVGANLVSALAQLIHKEGYEVVLLSATTIGASIAGPLAAQLSAPLVSEVVGINSDFIVERPLYGGKAVAKYKIKKTPAILTIRRKYFEKAELIGSTQAGSFGIDLEHVRLLAEREEKTEGVPLEDAEIIVTGGRGMGGANNFSLLRDLAQLLKGAVGASRGAVDEGWAPPTMQIGQTGKIVAPTIYFATGVSGASQHLAGIANAKCVIAINKDEEANIFKRARFGIVCDYKKIVPELIKALKEEL